jgi:hypothetical protein
MAKRQCGTNDVLLGRGKSSLHTRYLRNQSAIFKRDITEQIVVTILEQGKNL